MTESHNIELIKLTKKYDFLKKIKHIFLYYGIFMFFLLLLEEFGVLDFPFYESRLVFSLRVFLNTWVGIPIIFIEKKMKKIDARIREIESMYGKNSSKKGRQGDEGRQGDKGDKGTVLLSPNKTS